MTSILQRFAWIISLLVGILFSAWLMNMISDYLYRLLISDDIFVFFLISIIPAAIFKRLFLSKKFIQKNIEKHFGTENKSLSPSTSPQNISKTASKSPQKDTQQETNISASEALKPENKASTHANEAKKSENIFQKFFTENLIAKL